MLRPTTAVVILGSVICATYGVELGANDGPVSAEKPLKQPASETPDSDQAVVKDVAYGLEVRSDRLYLTSQPLSSLDNELRRVEVNFAIPKGAKTVELSLARLDGKNLMAVVKLRRGEEYEFRCLTFIAASGGHVREGFTFHQATFFTTRDDLKVLALGGKHFAGSVLIVLGDIDADPDEQNPLRLVTRGVFYFSGCPWPPSDGILSPFRVESIHPMAATN